MKEILCPELLEILLPRGIEFDPVRTKFSLVPGGGGSKSSFVSGLGDV